MTVALVEAPARQTTDDRAGTTATVTVVVPVYDEAASIEGVVERIVESLAGLCPEWRVLILNDGSTDWSRDLERRLADKGPVDLWSFYPNEGKGAVLNRAFPRLDSTLAVVIDADGEYSPADIPRVLQPLLDEQADWVMGSRYGFDRSRPAQYFWTYLVNRLINGWFTLLSGIRLRDLLTGLYAFRVDLVADVRLKEKRFSYTAELIWKLLHRRRLRWTEVPISYRFRTYAEGKKIQWWETGTILLALLRYKFSRKRA